MSNSFIPHVAFKSYGALYGPGASTGTIQRLIHPHRRAFTNITQLRYTAGTTAHVITVRQAIGLTFLNGNVSPAATTLTLQTQPLLLDVYGGLSAATNPPNSSVIATALSNYTSVRSVAANDYLVVERTDGQYDLWLVTSVAGLVVTLANAVTTSVSSGKEVMISTVTTTPTIPGQTFTYVNNARVWLMALDTDIVPGTKAPPPKFNTTVSTAQVLPSNDEVAFLARTPGKYEPLIVESNNVTAAGNFEYINATGSLV